jgi:hypothetical protein
MHVSNILRKLGASGRVQAAALAERAGLLHAVTPGPALSTARANLKIPGPGSWAVPRSAPPGHRASLDGGTGRTGRPAHRNPRVDLGRCWHDDSAGHG